MHTDYVGFCERVLDVRGIESVCRTCESSSRTVHTDVLNTHISHKEGRAEAATVGVRPYVSATDQRLQASAYDTYTTSTMSPTCPGCRLRREGSSLEGRR